MRPVERRPGDRRQVQRRSSERRPLDRRLFLVLCLLTGCATGSTEPAAGPLLPVPAGAQLAEVVRHVDGDTVVLRGHGRGPLPVSPTTVRLLQIDTPEVFGRLDCFGREASRRTAELLPSGARVRVQADVRRQDRYGRTLLLVWDESGRSVQETLVREGMARVLHVPPDDRALAELSALEREAREAPRGLWGACPERSATYGRTSEQDLAIGVAGENAGARQVHVLYGSGGGVTTEATSAYVQDTAGIPGVSEPGDGFAVLR